MAQSTSPSSILWQNDRKTVVLLDLPRSIEEAQVPSSQLTPGNGDPPTKLRRLVSALPPACPFPTPEPMKAGGSEPPTASPSAQVAELMTQAAVESALEEINTSYDGPWCLPRILTNPAVHQKSSPTSPRATLPAAAATTTTHNSPPPKHSSPLSPQDYHLPPNTHPLPTTIPPTPTTTTTTTTPSQPYPCPLTTSTPPNFFHLMLLDPPWPNRSAKRKRRGTAAYTPAVDTAAVRALLHRVPVASRLKPGGLVGVWVTNAERFGTLLTGAGGGGGVFAAWGVDVVGEWTWLKVTSRGETVVPVESRWRRPWERLVIGRKRGGDGGSGSGTGPVGGKVIVAVPDVHSRKPNLRGLFEELLPERYEALEVFARNLTAGWWAWGDEVLLFQRKECWVEGDEGGVGGDDNVVGEGNDKIDGKVDGEDTGT